MAAVRESTDSIFIKPSPEDQKRFTGHVRGSVGFLAQTASVPDEVEIQCSEPIQFATEYRCFILNKQILGIRHYKGDYRYYPEHNIVEAAMFAYKSSPVAYTLDFGVTYDGKTVLVEANDAFSLGAYGLPATMYARMIEVRWEEMTSEV